MLFFMTFGFSETVGGDARIILYQGTKITRPISLSSFVLKTVSIMYYENVLYPLPDISLHSIFIFVMKEYVAYNCLHIHFGFIENKKLHIILGYNSKTDRIQGLSP